MAHLAPRMRADGRRDVRPRDGAGGVWACFQIAGPASSFRAASGADVVARHGVARTCLPAGGEGAGGSGARWVYPLALPCFTAGPS